MRQLKMDISKKENGAYVKQGEVTAFYPLLSELGLNVEPKGFENYNDKGEVVGEPTAEGTGLPVYEDEKVQYAFDSILAAVKAQTRNKLQPGTAILKDGNKIAETLEELLATGERSGEALKIRREFLAALKDWLPKTGKSTAFQAAIYDLVSNVKVIPLQTDDRKGKIKALIAQFAESLTPEQATKYGKYLIAVDEACSAVNALDEEEVEVEAA